MHSPFVPLLLVALLSTSVLAAPDEVVLKNGEKLIGTVKSAAGGTLVFASESLGTVKVPFDKIVTFTSDAPVALHLVDGTVTSARIEAGSEGTVALVADGAPPRPLSIADIEKANPPSVKWTGSVTAGLVVTRGNSDTQSANVDAAAERRGEVDRIRAGAGYVEARQKNDVTKEMDTTARIYRANGQYDYFFSDTFYAYANARGERDAIAEVDLRFIGGVGAGQQWVEGDDFNLSTEEGISYFAEKFRNMTPSKESAASRFAYRVDGKPFDAVKLFHDTEWIHGLEESGDDLVTTQGGFRSSVTGSLFFEAKVQVNWDNTPAAGAERTDVRYILGLGWSF